MPTARARVSEPNGASELRGTVQKVFEKGPHGPYALASTVVEGEEVIVSFSLEKEVWSEDEHPDEGHVVVLGKLRQKSGSKKRKTMGGWRAMTARFRQPSDQV